MEANYLIEFRYHGYAKKYLKSLVNEVDSKFKLKNKKVFPHITMFGPFHTNHQREVINTFKKVCSRHNKIPFRLKGFSNFNKRVIYSEIFPSPELIKIRQEVAKELNKLKSFFIFKKVKTIGISDFEKKFYFHSTIAMNLGPKFDKVWNYLRKKKSSKISQHLLRLTLLRNGKILYEYDFLQKKLLNRRNSLSKNEWERTINKLKQKRWLDDID